ncbi:hypothetical protein BSKO_03228 [Bryopsis sp. KO-2023]|nr:hypothetical protein BSKO_03228 [Bryopsis sp. KO-2023]
MSHRPPLERALTLVGRLVVVDSRVYYPSKCSKVCTEDSFFEEELPEDVEGNRAYQWSIKLLSQIKANIDEQSPPGVGRMLAVFSACVYNAAASFKSWKPAFIKKIPGESRKDSFCLAPLLDMPVASCGEVLVDDVIDGAAFTAISAMFSDKSSFVGAAQFLQKIAGKSSNKGQELGEQICDEVINTFKADGFSVRGFPLSAEDVKLGYTPVNAPQEVPGVTQCPSEMKQMDKWQPLCVPTSFRPDKPADTCQVQEFLAPYAGQYTTFAVPEVSHIVPKSGPPKPDSEEFLEQAREVIEYSANLTDATKLVAEYWADGPDSTFPPGHWYRIAAESAKTQKLSVWETSKLLLLVGSALNDAGVTCWECKRQYDFVRPLQMIQCGFKGEEVEAWIGPYKGVGKVDASEWQPYQKATFVTPPFAGYVSGHSAFSAAAQKVMSLYFGDDSYRAPKCRLIEEGTSQFEGKIAKGEEGYIKGVTDVPNKGPKTKGYVPARDVVLCWETFDEASQQAGFSRLMGGIHIIADHKGGNMMVDLGEVGKITPTPTPATKERFGRIEEEHPHTCAATEPVTEIIIQNSLVECSPNPMDEKFEKASNTYELILNPQPNLPNLECDPEEPSPKTWQYILPYETYVCPKNPLIVKPQRNAMLVTNATALSAYCSEKAHFRKATAKNNCSFASIPLEKPHSIID